MSKKEYLVEIYKVEAEKYGATRDVQWKVNIAIWTVLLLGIYAKIQEHFKLSSTVGWIIVCLSVIVHFLFIQIIHNSQKRSLARLHNMATFLVEANEDSDIKWADLTKPPPNLHLWEDYLQIAITIFIVILFLSI